MNIVPFCLSVDWTIREVLNISAILLDYLTFQSCFFIPILMTNIYLYKISMFCSVTNKICTYRIKTCHASLRCKIQLLKIVLQLLHAFHNSKSCPEFLKKKKNILLTKWLDLKMTHKPTVYTTKRGEKCVTFFSSFEGFS